MKGDSLATKLLIQRRRTLNGNYTVSGQCGLQEKDCGEEMIDNKPYKKIARNMDEDTRGFLVIFLLVVGIIALVLMYLYLNHDVRSRENKPSVSYSSKSD